MKPLRILSLLIACISLAECALCAFTGFYAPAILSIAVFLLAVFLYVSASKQAQIQAFMRKRIKEGSAQAEEEAAARIEELETALRDEQLGSLQSQINPHFLYNTLDSIRSKALGENQYEIAEMSEKLAVFFRYCISNREQLVRLREELSHIRDYYAIQKFRFGERFDMKIGLEEEALEDLYVPRMVLQPIVENAIHHGVEKMNRKGEISIYCERRSADLLITVSDNGPGMDPDTLKEFNEKMRVTQKTSDKRRNGIAMHNTASRIRLTFGEDYGIRCRSLEGMGTDVEIRIPAVDDFARVRYDRGGTR